jgi:hypothetical protein
MLLSLPEAVRAVLKESAAPMSPGQIKDQIKVKFPHLFQTEAHRVGIERGNYQSFDHALLNPIYALVTRNDDFIVDRSSKPMRISLASEDLVAEAAPEENYEAEDGLVYVLSTGLCTESGKRIVKIGRTTQPLTARIAQLYTTGTPFQFKELHSWRAKDYTELEQAMHRLLSRFRINRSREFFTEEVLQFVQPIADLHLSIQALQVRE